MISLVVHSLVFRRSYCYTVRSVIGVITSVRLSVTLRIVACRVGVQGVFLARKFFFALQTRLTQNALKTNRRKRESDIFGD